jgi:hypothetical protein
MTLLDNVPVSATEPAASSSGEDGLRLRMRDRTGEGLVDGAWWPHSRDLAAELPPLLQRLWADGRDIFRVSYHLGGWDAAPSRLTIAGRQVKLGAFSSLDPASLSLVDSSGWRRLILLVVPADAEPGAGARALVAGGLDGDPRRPAEILAGV